MCYPDYCSLCQALSDEPVWSSTLTLQHNENQLLSYQFLKEAQLSKIIQELLYFLTLN